VTIKQLTISGLVSKETVVLRRWESETQTLDLSTELMVGWIGRRGEVEDWRFSVGPSSEGVGELWVVLGSCGERCSYVVGRSMAA